MELVRNNFSFYSPIKCLDVKLISHNDTVTLMFSCFSSGCTVVVGVGVSDWSGVEWSYHGNVDSRSSRDLLRATTYRVVPPSAEISYQPGF